MKKEKIKTIFMGNPSLSAIGLKALINSEDFHVQAVVSSEDKKIGRNLKKGKSAVKLLAEKENLKIISSDDIKEIAKKIKNLKPDLIVVIAYGKILPPEILEIPIYGCINVHASLLPKYRGASCIQAPILNGDPSSGISIMKMDEGMDTGPIIKKISIKLEEKETSSSLYQKTEKLISENLANIIKKYINQEIPEKKQDNKKASYVKIIKKKDGHLDFQNENAQTIERKIRAYSPWPGTYAFLSKENLPKKEILFKILKSENKFISSNKHLPGQIFDHNGNLAIMCQDLAILPIIIQLEGKKPLSSTDFIKGNSWIIGKILK